MELHLASMENITCWAYRSLFASATDSYTGVLSMNNLIRRNNAWKEIDTFNIPNQRQWIQVATSKEKECSEFIKMLSEEIKKEPPKDNIHGIQLNASCPSPNLIRIGQGPALIKRSTKIANLLKELLKQDKFKIGIKLRLGLNEKEVRERKILKLFEELEKIKDPNLTRISIHFKHAGQKSREAYDYSVLKELDSYHLPLIINGGINTPLDFTKIINSFEVKNVKGLMIGRATFENPNIFADFSNKLNQTAVTNKTLSETKRYFEELCKKHQPAPIYLETIKKYCSWEK
jgi:tRNA-dihydrouridine synthase